MTGPTIAIIPTRAALTNDDETYKSLLVRLQSEWTLLESHKQLGLRAIGELSEEAKRATEFQTLLVMQPRRNTMVAEDAVFQLGTNPSNADNELGAVSNMKYAIVMECQLGTDGVDIRGSFDSNAISNDKIGMLLSHYETVLRKLC
jgi:hypothetical protein